MGAFLAHCDSLSSNGDDRVGPEVGGVAAVDAKESLSPGNWKLNIVFPFLEKTKQWRIEEGEIEYGTIRIDKAIQELWGFAGC